MKRPLRALLCIATAGACAMGVARAETLAEAWERALTHDARLAAATATLESARAAERAAKGARLPQLGVSASRLRFGEPPQLSLASGGIALQAPVLEGDSTTMASAELQLPLFTGGRISGGIAAAREARRGAGFGEEAERAQLKLEVAESYVAVLRARRVLAAAQSSVASLAAHASDAQNLVEREMVARSDGLAARVALAGAEQQRVRAAHAVQLAVAAYNRRLGEPLDREPALEDAIPVDAALAAEPVEALVARALEARPEAGALQASARALAAQSRAARGAMLPQVALSGSRAHLDTAVLDRKDFTTVGIGLTWKLFDGGQAWNQAGALRSASHAEERRLDDLRSQIELQVRAAWLGVREAAARAAAAREAVAQAEENLRISRELYGSGLGTNTQVLDAVSLEVAARGNHDDAVLDEQLASLRLARAVGTL